VPWLSRASMADIRSAGWPMRRDSEPLLLLSLPSGMLSIQRTPADLRAVLWARWGHGGSVVWLDGREIDVPRDPDDGEPRTEESGAWVTDHVYAIEVAPRDHPLADWSRDFSGRQYGLLIADARTGRSRLEMPGPTERWESPRLSEGAGGTWRLFADADAADAGRVARTVPAF